MHLLGAVLGDLLDRARIHPQNRGTQRLIVLAEAYERPLDGRVARGGHQAAPPIFGILFMKPGPGPVELEACSTLGQRAPLTIPRDRLGRWRGAIDADHVGCHRCTPKRAGVTPSG